MASERKSNPRITALIEAATQHAGTEAELARQVSAHQSHVQRWKKTGVCPLDAQLLMAVIAGQDPDQVLHQALIEETQHTPRGPKVAAALGKLVLLIGAVGSWLMPTPDAHAMSGRVDTMRKRSRLADA